MTPKNAKGFTLIELLIVIAIIGFLAAAILVAVDPVRRIHEARNARRSAEVNAILNAVLNYQVDYRALYEGATGAGVAPGDYGQLIISGDGSTTYTCADMVTACPAAGANTALGTATSPCHVNLGTLAPDYIAEIPVDPSGSPYDDTNTGYYFRRANSGRITVGACNAEVVGGDTPVIKVTR